MDGCEVQKMKYDMFLGVSKVYRSLKEEEKLEHHSVLNEGKSRNSKKKSQRLKRCWMHWTDCLGLVFLLAPPV